MTTKDIKRGPEKPGPAAGREEEAWPAAGPQRQMEDLPVYPIRTVAHLTGVDARRIRAWESQHGLLRPARTKGGHRLFSKRDLVLIQRIKRLVDEEGLSLQGVKLLIQMDPDLPR
ncbi:MAG: MerR family transcriptional regulator [Armatimonadetes bacterium]|nr:MerR family transcriptional regulator [Armatimonadota bacterium]